MPEIEPRTRRDGRMERRGDRPQRVSIWQIVGGIALVGLAAIVIASIPDVKRYIKISTM